MSENASLISKLQRVKGGLSSNSARGYFDTRSLLNSYSAIRPSWMATSSQVMCPSPKLSASWLKEQISRGWPLPACPPGRPGWTRKVLQQCPWMWSLLIVPVRQRSSPATPNETGMAVAPNLTQNAPNLSVNISYLERKFGEGVPELQILRAALVPGRKGRGRDIRPYIDSQRNMA